MENVIGDVVKADGTVGARWGRAFVIINGKRKEVAELQKINGKLDFKKAEVKSAGTFWVQHKITGVEGTGSATWFFNTSELTKKELAAIKSGKQFIIDQLEVSNNDPASDAGSQVVTFEHVLLNSKIIGQYDGSSDDVLTEDADFTFDGSSVLKEFNQ